MYLGMLVGFLTLHLQGLLEWVFRQTQVMYLFFILSGLMVASERIRHDAFLEQSADTPDHHPDSQSSGDRPSPALPEQRNIAP
jgi:hypothetical protein